jgi:hypothetical protein
MSGTQFEICSKTEEGVKVFISIVENDKIVNEYGYLLDNIKSISKYNMDYNVFDSSINMDIELLRNIFKTASLCTNGLIYGMLKNNIMGNGNSFVSKPVVTPRRLGGATTNDTRNPRNTNGSKKSVAATPIEEYNSNDTLPDFLNMPDDEDDDE